MLTWMRCLAVAFALGIGVLGARGEDHSYVAVPHVTARALKNLEVGGKPLVLLSQTPLDTLYPKLRDEIKVPFIDGKASVGSVEPVNAFLKAKGFSLVLPPIGPGEVASAGTIQIRVKWPEKGVVDPMQLDSGRSVPGVSLPCAHFRAEGNDLAMVRTKEGISVYVMMTSESIPDDFLSLQRYATRLSKAKARADEYNHVHLPMIDLALTFEHKALEGASLELAPGRSYTLKIAFVQARLKLDETGAEAEAAEAFFTLGAKAEPAPKVLQINRDFVVWFEYKGVCYFAAHVFEDCMKRPSR